MTKNQLEDILRYFKMILLATKNLRGFPEVVSDNGNEGWASNAVYCDLGSGVGAPQCNVYDVKETAHGCK